MVAVSDTRLRQGPQVVAHRGASHDHPEHTLGAYLRAIEAGADALECDVRLTADGHLVCVHDRRVDRTSSGRGKVSTLELAQLEGLDWSSWKAGRDLSTVAELPDRDAGRLLTLRRLLSVVADAGRPLEVAVETKHPTRYAGQVEQELYDVLDYFGWARPRPGRPSPVRVMSFSTLALQRVRALSPTLPLVQLLDHVPVRMRDGRLPRGVGTAGISVELLRRDPRLVDALGRRGHPVHVWTVDEPDDVRRCLAAGVEAIITNRPDAVLAQLVAAGVRRGEPVSPGSGLP
ncbi:glycerophosphodiester phosphodiesterase family protein [Quadrisphaera sp. GCM10027208]|uniref:glycerophosphodiester phosphodiesterase family protein n=1 Tax=Quadrisphaera sp. GCM10027208 TaxID=3273423 RepID=UPI0036199564